MSTYGSKPPETLVETLRSSARRNPASGISILDRRGQLIERRTLAEALELAEGIARRLARIGVRAGTPVVIALPTSWAWLDAWLGTLLAGGLPVAISPASPLGATDENLRRLAALFRRLEGRHLVCTANLRRTLDQQGSPVPALEAMTPDELAALEPAAANGLSDQDPEETAFLQLTSGTTGESRVVMIPHRAAVHNAEVIGRAIAEPLGVPFSDAPNWQVVSWLPLYHDMGLVGNLLTAMVHGVEAVLMPPQAFLGRPRTWLSALGGTVRSVSAAPNFGYQFCVEEVDIDQLSDTDLASWRAALVGAETVRPETLDRFIDRFACRGLDPAIFRPCYGLAEAALAVTIDQQGTGYRTAPVPAEAGPSAAESVCLGLPVADTKIWAATPTGERLPEGRVGEIRVQGPGIFTGYLRDERSTAEAIENGTLLTGDLGFIRAGELYLTGRVKEILVVRGQNLMPDEIERIAEAELGGGGSRRAAVFAVDSGASGEQIVLLAEAPTREPEALRELERTIRSQVGKLLGLPIGDLAFVPSGKLPRTTSGKVPRRRLRASYLDNQVPRIAL